VRVCLGTACYVRGGKQVLEAFRRELGIDVGGTTPDGLFSLEIARCFGACGLAPTIMIDEDVHQRVKPLKLRAILESYRNGGPAKKVASRRPAQKPPRARKPGSPAKKAGARRVVARKVLARSSGGKKGAAR
jgi:(2Fe-2S) ferredoxin